VAQDRYKCAKIERVEFRKFDRLPDGYLTISHCKSERTSPSRHTGRYVLLVGVLGAAIYVLLTLVG